MRKGSPTLEQIRIAEPCNAWWDQMQGDERVRFCGECRKNVYNLSAMSRAEAEALVFETEGRLCVRFYRRRDGTVLTDNCPVGVRKAKIWLSVQLAGIAATFASLLSLGTGSKTAKMENTSGSERPPVVIPNQDYGWTTGMKAYQPSEIGKVVSPTPSMGEASAPPPSKTPSHR